MSCNGWQKKQDCKVEATFTDEEKCYKNYIFKVK